jgi:SAM-dependent methyltransferase
MPTQPPSPEPGLSASDPQVAPLDGGVSEHERLNRAAWNADADDYQARHGRDLAGDGKAWGTWGFPESELGVLGEVAGRIVFCDHGAMNFADPYRTVPEVARLLRPGGLFAFCHLSPIVDLCWPDDAERAGDRLLRDYFGMHRIDAVDEVVFQLPYGEWIRLFRASGFEILDLIEPRPAADAVSSYRDDAERDWARRWPAECIWRLRRT